MSSEQRARRGRVRIGWRAGVACLVLAGVASAGPGWPALCAAAAARHAAPVRPRVFTRVFALCVGIDRYRNVAEIEPLQFAESDARAMDGVLREVYGYESRLLCGADATRAGILGAIDEIGAAIDGVERLEAVSADSARVDAPATYAIVLYFAGHGATLSEPPAPGRVARRRGFFLPYDTSASLAGSPLAAYQDTAIDFGNLTRQILERYPDEERVLHVVMILDACFSGFASAPAPRGRSLSAYASICMYPTRQVLTAGTDLQQSYEHPEKEHGYFTGALLELLEGGREGNILTVGELFHAARMQVLEELSEEEGMLGRQEPQLRALRVSDGDFAFIPVNAEDGQVAGMLDPERPAASRGREEPISEERVEEIREKAKRRKPGDPPDLTQESRATFEDLCEAAAAGDPRAIEALYYCYASGIGTQRDEERARSWGQETCELGGESTAKRVMTDMLAQPKIVKLLEEKAAKGGLLGKSAEVLADPKKREMAGMIFEGLGRAFGGSKDPLSAIVASRERIEKLVAKNDWTAALREATRWKLALGKLPTQGQPEEVVALVDEIRSAIERLVTDGIQRTERNKALAALDEIENRMRELEALLRAR